MTGPRRSDCFDNHNGDSWRTAIGQPTMRARAKRSCRCHDLQRGIAFGPLAIWGRAGEPAESLVRARGQRSPMRDRSARSGQRAWHHSAGSEVEGHVGTVGLGLTPESAMVAERELARWRAPNVFENGCPKVRTSGRWGRRKREYELGDIQHSIRIDRCVRHGVDGHGTKNECRARGTLPQSDQLHLSHRHRSSASIAAGYQYCKAGRSYSGGKRNGNRVGKRIDVAWHGRRGAGPHLESMSRCRSFHRPTAAVGPELPSPAGVEFEAMRVQSI